MNALQEGLQARVHEAEAAKLAAEQTSTELLRHASKIEAELTEAQGATGRALEESRTERARTEAIKVDLTTLRDKYSALKRRYADAGRKVRSSGVSAIDEWPEVV